MNTKNLLFPALLVFVISIFSCTEEPAIVEYPPVAIIEVTPLIGDTTTVFTADADQSYDENNLNAILRFQWNWGENEIWSEYSLVSTSSHQYDFIGSYIVGVRVCDTSGWTDTDMVEITVVESN